MSMRRIGAVVNAPRKSKSISSSLDSLKFLLRSQHRRSRQRRKSADRSASMPTKSIWSAKSASPLMQVSQPTLSSANAAGMIFPQPVQMPNIAVIPAVKKPIQKSEKNGNPKYKMSLKVHKFICGLPLTGQAAFLYPKSFLSPQSGRKEILFMNNNAIILGIDHGYGNIKTAHTCFPTGVTTHEKEPTFHNDLLIYDGHFYTIGEGHKEFTADKVMDGDYYVLTLAAIAKELSLRRLTTAKVYLAVGLPLTWVSEQKDSFRAYLLHNESVDFTYQDTDYHVEFAAADIYPSGILALAARRNSDVPKQQAIRDAIPEFLRFNIVESEIRNL